MIGYVYVAESNVNKYVLKIYRHFNKDQALQSIDVIEYLKKNDYPVVSIVQTHCGNSHITISTPDGESIGILYDYIEGIEPNIKTEIEEIGMQVGELHTLMSGYTKPLINRGKEFYIDRFIEMIKKLEYNHKRIKDFEEYGTVIWSAMEKLPNSFCHGDLHSGNMFKTESGKYVPFDFDIASNAYSIIDIATLCNDTHFNNLEESSYYETMMMLERFYKGYSKEKNVSNNEVDAILNFIGARHYELIATITECKGLHSLNKAFIDQQYEWLMSWRNICNKKNI